MTFDEAVKRSAAARHQRLLQRCQALLTCFRAQHQSHAPYGVCRCQLCVLTAQLVSDVRRGAEAPGEAPEMGPAVE